MTRKNNAILLLGSNIDPAENLKSALQALKIQVALIDISSVWKTAAVGSDGPDFLNMAVEVETEKSAEELKACVINRIERKLKRLRSADKYAPRTIDVDIIIFNNEVLDDNLWERVFIALPVSELRPALENPENTKSIKEIAEELKNSTRVEFFSERMT